MQFGEPLFVRDGLATPSCLHGGTPKARRAVARVGAAIAAPGSTGYRHNKNAFAVSWLYPALIHDNNSCCRGKAEGRRPVRPSHRSPIPPTSGVIGRKIKEFAKSQSDLKNPPPTACRHSVSGSVSLPLSGCFSPFPHGTCSLSVIEEYLGLEGGPPTFRQDFSCPALLKDPQKTLPIRGYHPLWPAFPDRSGCFSQATGLVRVRSPLLTESRLMSFPPATEMFQFAGFASYDYVFIVRYRRSGGLPHSEILGSKLTGSSPRLNAACHVLHRLSMPRHPPNALQTLDHTQPHAGNKGQISKVSGLLSERIQIIGMTTKPIQPRV